MGYIYLLIDTRNGKKYVGKHNGNKKNYWSSGIIPNRIAKKYGRDIFNRCLLEDNIPKHLLNEKEIYYINKENSFLDGYNTTVGGDGGGDSLHRMWRHHSEGIFEMEKRFGTEFTNSDGKIVYTRYVGEQHVKEDCNNYLPSAKEWMTNILENKRPQWMLRTLKIED